MASIFHLARNRVAASLMGRPRRALLELRRRKRLRMRRRRDRDAEDGAQRDFDHALSGGLAEIGGLTPSLRF